MSLNENKNIENMIPLRSKNKERAAENRLSTLVDKIAPENPASTSETAKASTSETAKTSKNQNKSISKRGARGGTTSRGKRGGHRGRVSRVNIGSRGSKTSCTPVVSSSSSLNVSPERFKTTMNRNRNSNTLNISTTIRDDDSGDEKSKQSKIITDLTKDLLSKAVVDEFPLVKLTFGQIEKSYSSVLNWFELKKKYNEKPEKIKLKCKLCDYKCEIKLGNSNENLNYQS